MTHQIPNLQAAMEAASMSGADLARATGWSEAKVSRLISGITGDITVATLAELERALGAKVSYLLAIDDVAQTAEERELLLNFRKAQERDRQIALATVAPRNPD